MLNLICNLISKIVFSGINGTILIPLIGFLLWIVVGQVNDCISINKKIFRGGIK
ncbi:hypothetical protein ACR77J_12340 [Tissierella praeacuta]|uniref:hypothetical protein n=1 Tax=Tissierella praeacuta TaxID=43131 RepID=UPI001404CD74|nr:hypothetical protein [Tissierella praeacuta]